jgi:hypothetical protein
MTQLRRIQLARNRPELGRKMTVQTSSFATDGKPFTMRATFKTAYSSAKIMLYNNPGPAPVNVVVARSYDKDGVLLGQETLPPSTYMVYTEYRMLYENIKSIDFVFYTVHYNGNFSIESFTFTE